MTTEVKPFLHIPADVSPEFQAFLRTQTDPALKPRFPDPGDLESWKKGLAKIAGAKNRNVMCKVSGLYANVTADQWPAEKLAPLVRTVIDHFGWDRVLFASDWPVVNLGASFKVWCEAVKQIVRADKPENQAKLFRENAVKFYGLA